MTSAPPDRAALAGMIDHTLLDPAATAADLDRLCAEALELGFANVCVNPVWAERCVARLRSGRGTSGPGVGVCAVVGFPLGANLTEVKVLEARRMVVAGVREVDVMIHLGALKGGDYSGVLADLAAVVAASSPITAKAILETTRLTDDEKVSAARLALEAGAAFVKTSTGFAGGGATVEDVKLLRELVGPGIGVKASGGIRTLDQALALRAAGASRLGTSAGVAILRELEGRA
jgi:deoxyribose-phosphate aldolase